MVKTYAVILAAGQAKRMNANKNKMFLELKKPILAHTIETFEDCVEIGKIILVVNENEILAAQEVVKAHGFRKVIKFVNGGAHRQQSSYNGVMAVEAEDDDILIVQDGARPFIRHTTIGASIRDAIEHGASVVAVPAKNTIKTADVDLFVDKTLDRNILWEIQTPQTFKYKIIKEAHERAKQDGFLGTDESVLVERHGVKVKLTQGHYDNIKITTPDDLILAEHIIRKSGGKNV